MHNLRGGVSSTNILKGNISSTNTVKGSLSIGKFTATTIDPDVIKEIIEDYLKNNLPESGGVEFETDNTLTLENGILSVNTTNNMEQDNTLPITSAGVYATVGNIEALLKTI